MASKYDGTLNLPKTSFPMRAGLPQREPNILKKWNDEDIYSLLMEKNADLPLFVLHDGPPYANGDIHIGTAMNKIIKDIIVRYKNMTGFKSPYVPGWDCHGLPTESAIIKKTKIDRHKMSVAEFRDRCRDFAMDYINKQRTSFRRLGVIGDWEHPYITMLPEFEAAQIKVFGEMCKKGIIYRGFKNVYWCPEDETALAEAEIEYKDDPCTSIYVRFRVKDDKGKLSRYAPLDKMYFVIWTTTTWTLPGNLAICLNADLDYALMKLADGNVYIVAKELADGFAKKAGIENYEIIAELKGSEFELMTAQHPFLDRESVILNGEHVTLEAGTGCVHTAPGFGADDFAICKKYDDAGITNIGVVVPVDEKGYQTAEAGKYAGLRYDKSNDAIFEDLKASGDLIAFEKITHQYPHCWRCKNPIIYRSTEQWFASVSRMKEAAVAACDGIKWHPEWGKDRMVQMIEERSDWCISRQRNWGVPIPIFYCKKCGKPVINDDTINKISDMFRAEGSNAWFRHTVEELIPEGLTCPECGCREFDKETDIMDVWFDSGSSHAAVLEQRPELRSPADIYLEGADQYRGWFQSSMLTSIAARGRAPYKQIITHGWTVDGEGRAMHKSLGNAVAPEDIIKDWGADILRLWVASVDYTNDARISKEILSQLSDSYRKIRNTVRILLANLGDFDPDKDMIPLDRLQDIDKWALSRLSKLIKDSREAYDRYEFHYIYHYVVNFVTVDMSKLYIDITKDRCYVEKADSEARRSAQTAMFIILDAVTRLISPLLAYTSEEIWEIMPHRSSDDSRGVVLNTIPDYTEYGWEELEEGYDRLFDLRDGVMKSLEEARAAGMIGKSLEAKLDITASGEQYDILKKFEDQLPTVFIVSAVSLDKADDGDVRTVVSPAEGKKCARCWMVTDDGEDDDGDWLCRRCYNIVKGCGCGCSE
ncbi:MAG: isoleucine--tRNA ligase [Clostridiales bacterium]|nr:isoleucine--tRNA ligase [Clostridiales bacterium]